MDRIVEKERINLWSTVDDDELRMTDKVVEFLQGEFCPQGTDPMWSKEYFRWKLGPTNPAGKGYISIAMSGDRVVGTASLTRKRLLIDGNEYIGGEMGDTYSSTAIRRRGRPISLSLNDPEPNSYINKSVFGRLVSDVRARAVADGISIIYGTPNQNSYQGYINKLGFFDLKDYNNRSFSRPTTKLVTRMYPSTRYLTPLLQNIDFFLLAIQKHIYGKVLYRKLTFEICIPSADEIDELWSRLKPVKGFSFIRDAAYWRHRYLENPIAQYTFFILREKGHLVGVIVTRLFSVAGKRVVSIAEWMNDRHIPFGYAISVVINYYKDTGVEVFNLWAEGASLESKAAARSLFFSKHRVPIILADTPQARSLKSMVDNIKFYIGNSDNV